MAVVKPRRPDRKHTWAQEVQIADRGYREKKVAVYSFTGRTFYERNNNAYR